jgi:hypothetical protein
MLLWMNKSPVAWLSTASIGNVLASAKPLRSLFFHTAVLPIPLQPLRFSPKLKLQNCFAVMQRDGSRGEVSIHHSIERNVSD